jgi:alpha-amylase/alpha-mannosidase (GH57 family)
MKLALFLHIYQPPTQFADILAKICDQSYRKIIKILLSNPEARLTLNICGSLTEQLAREGHQDIIENLKILAKRGQIELTGSAKYHPLLPKIPKSEAERQIKLNDETNRKFFGEVWKPVGFFPPEMAYSREVGDLIEGLGFSWIILEEYAFDPAYGKPREDVIYKRKGKKLRIFFRNKDLSVRIAFGHISSLPAFFKVVSDHIKREGCLVLATDGETFGHHQPGLENFLGQLLSHSEIKTFTLSEILAQVKKTREIEPLRSTWGISEEDWLAGNIYPKWDIPGHPIHPLQWRLTKWVIDIVARAESRLRIGELDPNLWSEWQKARETLDKAINSDQYWWASHNPLWHYQMVLRSTRLFEEVLSLTPGIPQDEKERGKNLANEIIQKGLELWGDRIINR